MKSSCIALLLILLASKPLFARDSADIPGIDKMLIQEGNKKVIDKEKANHYYKRFLDKIKTSELNYDPENIDNIHKRIEYLKTNPAR
jgi:hypothetical protein